MLNADLERLPRVFGGSNPHLSPRMERLLEQARQEMQNFKDDFISVEHLLLAMFDIGDGAAQRVLKSAGLSRDAGLKALASIRGAHRVTDQNPKGTSQPLDKSG